MRRTRSGCAASSLKGMIGRYEGADGRCRHEIFRDILLLAAICAVWAHRDFLAYDPSRHLRPASNTPDPEFPVVATSLITVGNLLWTFCGNNCGDMIRDRAVPSG